MLLQYIRKYLWEITWGNIEFMEFMMILFYIFLSGSNVVVVFVIIIINVVATYTLSSHIYSLLIRFNSDPTGVESLTPLATYIIHSRCANKFEFFTKTFAPVFASIKIQISIFLHNSSSCFHHLHRDNCRSSCAHCRTKYWTLWILKAGSAFHVTDDTLVCSAIFHTFA